MATHFSANQYEGAFSPKHLQNYQVPAQHKERPSHRQGTTKIIANDRGHLNKGIPRDTSSPWGSFVGTWQAEIRPPVLMTKTKLVNPRTIIRSPPCTTVAEGVKPVSTQEENKPPSPATSKAEEAAADTSRTGSATKPTSPKSTKPSSPATSKVEEATVASNRSGSPMKPLSPKPNSVPTTPVSDKNSDIPVDQQQPTTPAKPTTPQQTTVTTTSNNTTVATPQTNSRPPSKTAVTPDTSTKPEATASVSSPTKGSRVTTPQ